MAQLNVDADSLATQYQREHGHRNPDVLLTDQAGVHLVLAGEVVTSNYAVKIRYQATYGPLLRVLQERYGWDAKTASFINWKANGTSLRRRMKRRSHYIKLVQGILPTNRKLHRKDQVRRLCPACYEAIEDWQHILKCPHPSRQEWRQALLRLLDEQCNALGTRPILWTVLHDGICGWCTHSADVPFRLDASQYHPALRRLIWQQNRIGWQQLFLGRFSQEWGALQDAYYARKLTDEETKRRTGPRWQVTIISLLWDRWYKLWELRNKDLHGATAQQRAEAARREAYRDLRDIYDVRAHLESPLQALLLENVETHMAHPTWHIQEWLAINSQLFREGIRRWRAQLRVGTPSIRSFFTPRSAA